MKLHLVIATALLLPFVPGVSAADPCPPGNDATTAISHPTGGQLLFYVSAEPGLYEETNGWPGLQSAGGSCIDGEGNTVDYAADARVA